MIGNKIKELTIRFLIFVSFSTLIHPYLQAQKSHLEENSSVDIEELRSRLGNAISVKDSMGMIRDMESIIEYFSVEGKWDSTYAYYVELGNIALPLKQYEVYLSSLVNKTFVKRLKKQEDSILKHELLSVIP